MNLWVSCLFSKATKLKNFSARFQENICRRVKCTVFRVNGGSVSMEPMYSLLVFWIMFSLIKKQSLFKSYTLLVEMSHIWTNI